MAMDMLVKWQRVSRSAVIKLDGRGEVGGRGRRRGRDLGHTRWRCLSYFFSKILLAEIFLAIEYAILPSQGITICKRPLSFKTLAISLMALGKLGKCSNI